MVIFPGVYGAEKSLCPPFPLVFSRYDLSSAPIESLGYYWIDPFGAIGIV
jgi:hypothetical protein